jgi:hypothetical protein
VGDEVPPHEDRFWERFAAEQNRAGRFAHLKVRSSRPSPRYPTLPGSSGLPWTATAPSRTIRAYSKSVRSGTVAGARS